MQYNSPRGFTLLPTVVKNLIIINGLVFLFLFASEGVRIWMVEHLSLWFPASPYFNPIQLITYQFMHAFRDPFHLIFNMFSLWMFGTYVENTWGPKRFLIYYLVCGVGAALFHLGIGYIEYMQVIKHLSPDEVRQVIETGTAYNEYMARLGRILYTPMVGASGAIYGILIAYGWFLFPNSYINLYFFIPMKAKYFVLLLMGISLVSGLMNNAHDNVAHFAHLGGGLVGFIYLNIGKLRRRRF